MLNEKKEGEIRDLISDNMLRFHNYEYKNYINDYKAYIWDMTDRLSSIKNWKNNVSWSLTYMMVDVVYTSLFDFDYKLNIKWKNLEKAVVDAFDFKNKSKEAMWMAIKEALIVWTWIVRDNLYLEKNKEKVFWNTIETEIKSPTLEYISVFNVMYDSTVWLDDSDYKIIRQFLWKETIINNIFSNIQDKEKKEKLIKELDWKLKKDDNSFSYYNYEAIKWLMFTSFLEEKIMKKKSDPSLKVSDFANDNSLTSNISTVSSCDELRSEHISLSPLCNNFNTKYEVVEFIEWDKKHIFINGNYVLSLTVYPWINNIVSFNYNVVPWSGRSMWIARILRWINSSHTWLLNMFLDSLKQANTNVFRTEWIAWKNKSNKIVIEDWQILNWNIARIDLWWWSFLWMNWMQAVQQLAQTILWINWLVLNNDNRVQRVAWAFDFAISQYKWRLTPFTDNIDAAMSKIVRWWILQYLNNFTREELEKYYGIIVDDILEDWTEKLIWYNIDWINLSDILNERKLSFKFDSMYNLKKESRKKTLMEIFQLAMQYNNAKIDKEEFIKALTWNSEIEIDKILWLSNDKIKELTEEDKQEFDSLLNTVDNVSINEDNSEILDESISEPNDEDIINNPNNEDIIYNNKQQTVGGLNIL